MADYDDAPETLARPEEEHRFPCPECGANMRFDPGKDQLICDHCGHSEAIGHEEAEAPTELDFREALSRAQSGVEMEEVRVSQCRSCGAQIEFAGADHALECPFCATPVVADTGTSRHIKPKGILPFTLTESEARAAMGKWLGRLWFAPNGLKEYARRGRAMDGIYVPYWTYDADTKSQYRGQRGTYYYVNQTRRGSDGKTETVRVRKTAWRPASGRVARFFDDILILASKSLPKHYTDGLAPWDLAPLKPYSVDFISGFKAEAYQVQLDEGFEEARAIMDAQIRQDVRRDIGGDEQRITSVSTEVSAITFKHVLLPVWMAAYKYRGQSYRFVVNGQTGKVRGERPWSKTKIAFAVLAGLILLGVGLYLYGQYGDY